MWLLAIIFIIIIILLVIALIYLITYQVLMNPNSEIEEEPQEDFQNLYLPIDSLDGVAYTREEKPHHFCINVWYFDKFADRKEMVNNTHKTMLFFHGNSYNISKYRYIIEVCKQQKLNLLLVDYRGYGKSGGMPSLKGICTDGCTAYHFLKEHCKPENIIVWGESMGGVPATYVASQYECKSLVLLGAFSSLEDLILHQQNSSWMTKSMGMIVPYIMNNLPNKQWIRNVEAPILIVHSENDDLVPYKCAEINHENARCNKKKIITIDGGHKTPQMSLDDLREIFGFIGLDKRQCNKEMLDNLLKNIHCITSTI